MIARVLCAALLGAGLAAPGLAAEAGAGREAAVSDAPEESTATERVLERALQAVDGVADQLDGVRTGAIAAPDASLAIREQRAELDLHLLVWRNASEEDRVAARTALADPFAAAEARLDDAETAFADMDRPALEVAEALAGPPTLADFAREPPIEILSGVYAEGFETSDFTPLDGEAAGPFWLEASADAQDSLNEQPRLGEGRGGRLLLALQVEGWIETGEKDSEGGGYGHLGAYPGRVYVERVVNVRPLDEAEYRALLDEAQHTRAPSAASEDH